METIQLLIGTTNPGKVKEISAVINGLPIQISTPADFNIFDDIEETGTSYQENATIKAQFYAQKVPSSLVLGEDSGIIVESLQDQLGLHTRRWGAGANASDKEWLEYFMNEMQRFPDASQRKAKFVSHMCLLTPLGDYHFYGETEGYISYEIEAPLYAGLPLSSVFKPVGFDQVYSALSEEQKNQISHRGKAIVQVKKFLIDNYGS
jgi:XTP/dITP diphosphohydrolase